MKQMLPVLFLVLLAPSKIFGIDNCDSRCKLVEYQKALESAVAVHTAQNKVLSTVPAKLVLLTCRLADILGDWREPSIDFPQEGTNADRGLRYLPKIGEKELLSLSMGIRDTLMEADPSLQRPEFKEMETLLSDIIPVPKEPEVDPDIFANAINSQCGQMCVGNGIKC
ncbi:uncharacterized protein LOC108150833 [Drosophila miranda]|uniref:uncharacterized protein LOC108150833 n=1 Tax=Drosophila miranda TaxID=7229 RepID=UPI00143FA5D5|nr:uncharacterized protein LOC108150833 [Drosophila miranda]